MADSTAWDTMTIAECGEALEKRRKDIAAIFEKYPNLSLPSEMVDEVKQMNRDLDDGHDRYKALELLAGLQEKVRQSHEVTPVSMPAQEKSTESPRSFHMGKALRADENYMRAKSAAKPRFVIELNDYDMIEERRKTLMTTTTGFPPESVRSGLVVPYALRRPVVADLIPQDNIDQPSVVYMEETTFTNNAAAVAEGDAKPESALAYTQRTQPVEVIATWIPVTRQQLDDVPQLEALLNNRLRLMLALAEENELLNGDGTTPNLGGFYNKSGVQTQAKGTDPVPDAVYRAMTKVRFGSGVAGTGFAEPSGIIMHPNDWQDVRLLRTVNGEYIWGSPADEGVERMWGLPVVATPAATENTGLVGDFQLYSHISRKMGVTLDVSDQHASYFIENKLAIRIEERLSLEIYRPSAFCLVTGI